MNNGKIAISVSGLTKKFDDFTAVNEMQQDPLADLRGRRRPHTEPAGRTVDQPNGSRLAAEFPSGS